MQGRNGDVPKPKMEEAVEEMCRPVDQCCPEDQVLQMSQRQAHRWRNQIGAVPEAPDWPDEHQLAEGEGCEVQQGLL